MYYILSVLIVVRADSFLRFGGLEAYIQNEIDTNIVSVFVTAGVWIINLNKEYIAI